MTHILAQIVESGREDIFCQMPVMRLVPVRDEEDEEEEEEGQGGQHSYTCPLFQNSERSGEDNFIIELGQFHDLAHVVNLCSLICVCQACQRRRPQRMTAARTSGRLREWRCCVKSPKIDEAIEEMAAVKKVLYNKQFILTFKHAKIRHMRYEIDAIHYFSM